MCEASHMKFDPVCHQISQVYMYEHVTSGPSQGTMSNGFLYRQVHLLLPAIFKYCIIDNQLYP